MTSLTVSSNTRRGLWAERARRHPDDPYAWAMAHRTVAGRPLEHLPALVEIARDRHPLVVIQKSAQVGASELLVNRALHAADTTYADRGHVLFLMPMQNQMDDFAQGRIDRAIQDSPHLRARLQPEPPRRKGADNKRLKLLGQGAVYLRGADSRRQIASVDADLVILDEFDQMDDGVLDLARKRIASSRQGQLIVASTPRLPEAGVNAMYLQSDQRRYLLPCPACALEQALTWEDNVDQERALVVCRACRAPMNVRATGRWEAQAPGNEHIHGYHLSRLYAPWANIKEMVESNEMPTPFAQQEFHNSDLGEPFVPPGGRITLDVLDRCRRDYLMPDGCEEDTYMGIDVGTKLHVVIRASIENGARSRALSIEIVHSFEALAALARRFHVVYAVVDALPEQHSSQAFARSAAFPVDLAYYNRNDPGDELVFEKGLRIRRVNRTQRLDEMFQSFFTEASELPSDARGAGGYMRNGLGEYYREMTALSRTLEPNAAENLLAKYTRGSKADHFAHAELYCQRALAQGPQDWDHAYGLYRCTVCDTRYKLEPPGWTGPSPRPCFRCGAVPPPGARA